MFYLTLFALVSRFELLVFAESGVVVVVASSGYCEESFDFLAKGLTDCMQVSLLETTWFKDLCWAKDLKCVDVIG